MNKIGLLCEKVELFGQCVLHGLKVAQVLDGHHAPDRDLGEVERVG